MAKIAIFILFIFSLHADARPLEEIVGLVARQPPVHATMLKQLTCIGIDYIFGPSSNGIKTNRFVADFNRKSKIFQKRLELAPIRPSKRTFVNDTSLD